MRAIPIRKDGKLIGTALYCNTLFSRVIGLMLRKPQMALIELTAESTAMAAIHTFFMRFPIDVYWVDSDKTINAMKKDVKPYSFAKPEKQAKYILEVPAGKLRLKTGERLGF